MKACVLSVGSGRWVCITMCVCNHAEKRKIKLERESCVFLPIQAVVLDKAWLHNALSSVLCANIGALCCPIPCSFSAGPVQTKPSHTQAPIESRAWGSSQCWLLKGILALRFKIFFSWTSSRIKSVFYIGIRQIHFCWTETEIWTWIHSYSTPTDHKNMV